MVAYNLLKIVRLKDKNIHGDRIHPYEILTQSVMQNCITVILLTLSCSHENKSEYLHV